MVHGSWLVLNDRVFKSCHQAVPMGIKLVHGSWLVLNDRVVLRWFMDHGWCFFFFLM